jgi:hypothetical protein
MSVSTNEATTHSDVAIPAPATPPPAVPSRPRTWLRRIVGGGQIIETCPTFRDGATWCANHHANDDEGNIDDLSHGTEYVSTAMTMHVAGSGVADWPILAARINVDPYSENPKRNIPHITFEPSVDDVVECLTPDEFGAAIAQIRAHCDRLEEVRALAVLARAEYGVQPTA